ncbi:MAG TPA: DUF2889 domain-containing protein [Blastocatellia bacterium]|jgi:hypothetical protein|nr:DUF2889 domain-containing protein [Blastocatellia bacterium]
MATFSRTISVEMDWLDKASFEIRGTLDDDVHSLAARFVISYPDFIIREAAGEITRMPYPGFCTGSVAAITNFVGTPVGRGFRKRAGEVVGGASSCNHLHTLVNDMAACAFQMNYHAAKQRPEAQAAMREAADDPRLRREMVLGWMPQLRNSCFLFSEASDALFDPAGDKKADGDSADGGESNGKIL